MSGAGAVVADTTPLNYLSLIGEIDVLGSLFGEVWVPEAVMEDCGIPTLRMR